MKTKISGASDDLIEISGEIEEEHGANYGISARVQCSDGTSFLIGYDGTWDVTSLIEGKLFIKVVKAVEDESRHLDEDAMGCCSYSDVLVLDEGIEWVKIGKKKYNRV